MKEIVPDYYKEFQCTAGACRHNCCVGWEIDIDDDTWAVYQNTPGAFGEKLKENMVKGEENSFILLNHRCPFLKPDNLCEIYLKLGPDSLCSVCTQYPRFTEEFPDRIERGLGLSCEEAGRLLFSKKTPVSFKVCQTEQEYQTELVGSDLFEALLEARNVGIYILQKRELPFSCRMASLLTYAAQIQEAINKNQPETIKNIEPVFGRETRFCQEKNIRWYRGMQECVQVFESLEVMNDDWSGILKRIKENLILECENEERYKIQRRKFLQDMKKYEYQYEHLAVYFIFRYFLKALYDNDVLSKVKLTAVSVLMIQEMDFILWKAGEGNFGLEERIETARIYSEEIEHSEENLQYLTEEFLFHDCFGTENLARML